MTKEPISKRMFDIVLSGIMIFLSIPVFFPIAFAIRLEDGGPVFYRQKRYGKKETRFNVFKFRTMVPDSDQRFGITQAGENDIRITRIGRILRAMGLDELPQILTILTGKMSFVGPRSLAVGEIINDTKGRRLHYEDIPGFRERLRVRPGLTGLATIYIPKDASPRRKFRYDMLYIRKQSFCLDLYLIALSFFISFRGKWETRTRKI